MPAEVEIRAANIKFGRRIKRRNALTALLSGGILAASAGVLFPFKPLGLFVGFLVGLVYSNAFEYALHRFVLHAAGGFLQEKHGLHHTTWGGPEEALYVNFARSPWVVVLLFAVNALPVVVTEWLFRWGIAPGVLIAFTVYFVLFEEIHWRIHIDGWLPTWIAAARQHHLRHHAGENERFNVFLPLFDWLLGRF